MDNKRIRLASRTKATLVNSLDTVDEASRFIRGSVGSLNRGLGTLNSALDESLYEGQEDALNAKVSLIKAKLQAKKELIKLGMTDEKAEAVLAEY